ncbi:MAG: hypothetical protein ACU833_15260 [Gammaproteobacteria bacterium]
MTGNSFTFNQIHIEAARNASDDFNLFHDKHKWLQITHNPFKGPIVLGFQLNTLIEHQMLLYRKAQHEDKIVKENDLRFSNYQITFVNAVRPDQPVALDIKKTLITTIPELTLGNRISIKSDGRTVLLGFKKETQHPLVLPDTDLSGLPDLESQTDRSLLPGGVFFLKKKYMNNGNAKNFLSGSLAEQSDYFDELNGKVNYPEMFPCSLTSNALLEKARIEGHDFKTNPMVYTSHQISVDRTALRKLKSHDKLFILVKQQPESEKNKLSNTDILLRVYDCYGLTASNRILFRARLSLAPLEGILNGIKQR